MHKVGIVALVGLLAFGLAGCGEEQSNDASARAAGETETSATETPAPLTSGAPTLPSESENVDGDFTTYVRSQLLWDSGIKDATDEQLIAAGHEACKQLLAGAQSLDMRLVEGEQMASSGYYMDSGNIIDGARRFYCPETIY